jgi:hypothetical protein
VSHHSRYGIDWDTHIDVRLTEGTTTGTVVELDSDLVSYLRPIEGCPAVAVKFKERLFLVYIGESQFNIILLRLKSIESIIEYEYGIFLWHIPFGMIRGMTIALCRRMDQTFLEGKS